MRRLRLDVGRSAAGRLNGRLVSDDGTTDVPFDGTLELLRVLEELVDEEPGAANAQVGGQTSR